MQELRISDIRSFRPHFFLLVLVPRPIPWVWNCTISTPWVATNQSALAAGRCI